MSNCIVPIDDNEQLTQLQRLKRLIEKTSGTINIGVGELSCNYLGEEYGLYFHPKDPNGLENSADTILKSIEMYSSLTSTTKTHDFDDDWLLDWNS